MIHVLDTGATEICKLSKASW